VKNPTRNPFALRRESGPAMDTLQEVALRAKLQALLQQHRDLDAAIQSLEETGTGDQLQLRRLKKMKLDLKDQILKIENLLIPDIIA
jgi:hypothetical protein